MNKKNAIVLVEPISTIKHAIEIIQARKIIPIVVFTNYKVHPENEVYEIEKLRVSSINELKTTYKNCVFINETEDYNELVQQLSKYEIKGVLKGSDGGVRLGEKLAISFGLKSNPTGFFDWAMDKNLVNSKVIAGGVRGVATVAYHKNDSFPDIAKKIKKYPVFVKPTMGAGGVNSWTIFNEKVLKEKLTYITNIKASGKQVYEEILIQELINGEEYVVNTFSEDGIHYAVEVWKYIKKLIPETGSFIYINTILLNGNSLIKESVVKYAIDVLDALDFKNGPCHMEIKVDADGPALIECNWRIMGGSQFYDADLDFGKNTCEMYLNIATDPNYCKRKLERKLIDYNGYAECIDIMPQIYGEVTRVNMPHVLRKMKSYYWAYIFAEKGTKIIPCTSMDENLGNVQFLHKDFETIKKDAELFLEIKDNCLEVLFDLKKDKNKKPNKLVENSQEELNVLTKFVGHDSIQIITKNKKNFTFSNQKFISNFNQISRSKYLLLDLDKLPSDTIKLYDYIDKLEKMLPSGITIIITNKTVNAAPKTFKYLLCLNNLDLITPCESRLIDDFSFFKKR